MIEDPDVGAVILVRPEENHEHWYFRELLPALATLGIDRGEAFEVRRCSSSKLAAIAENTLGTK